ncbi:DUF2625 domain-containing protein [Neisseria zalophi]|uniref:DUF2625 domain-containing protein n=1 Tax=Neisseria zalophi TaxID=640030 RepID=A0A5J6PSK3_9NEIS|nr:DUF2625 domain-containing protein [Neisseria zalophi]QEY25609.1 DUF2625 domain-containing protein [Neisseria zalophi]
MKELKELINLEESGWDFISEWLEEATNDYEILEKDPKRAEQELINTQVTTRSPMGALIYETGGILIDSGWLRILGSGSTKLNRGLMEWNQGKTYEKLGERPTHLLIADDIVGGYFAINAGGIGNVIGNIYYLAPDFLEWEDTELGYSDFLYWTLTGNLEMYYENVRWSTWKEDIKKANGNQTFSFVPFLWTDEGQDIDKTDRKLVPTEENYHFMIEMQRQLNRE